MLFFLAHGYRVIAHDRRGHGRSAQVSEGNNMDRYTDDLAELVEHLDLHDAIHVGHSAGGGEVARYIGRHGESRVAKAVLISAVTPSVLQTDANPAGVPQAAFEALQAQLAANRSAASWQAVESGLTRSFGPVGRRGEWQRHVERGAPSARTADGKRAAKCFDPVAQPGQAAAGGGAGAADAVVADPHAHDAIA